MAKKKVGLVGERLDPPMTAKERRVLRQVQAAVSAVVAGFQFANDPGMRSMAAECSLIWSESTNRLVQAYRDGKEE